MAVEIKMPQLSDTMSEGTILTWLKQEGEQVERGDAIAEVATDKADLEIESFHDGTLLKILAGEGKTVSTGDVIAVLGKAGEEVVISENSFSPDVPDSSENTPNPVSQNNQVSSPPSSQQENLQQAVDSDEDRVKISPLAKNLASKHGVNYNKLSGSGEGGRIVKRDIEAVVSDAGDDFQSADAVETTNAQSSESRQDTQLEGIKKPIKPLLSQQGYNTRPMTDMVIPMSRMRSTIANRMVESTTTIPHFFTTTKISVDEMISMRKNLKTLPQYEGLTYTHLIAKAVGLALRSFPRINSSYSDSGIVQHAAVNVGIITAVPDGLLIPVIKQVDELSLSDVASEARALIQRARTGRPKGDDLTGGTFSISNMGMFAVESFTAIINPGQGAILAVSAIDQEPTVVDGELSVSSVMRLTLSVDHRIIDGVMCGEFLTELKRLIETPVLLVA